MGEKLCQPHFIEGINSQNWQRIAESKYQENDTVNKQMANKINTDS